MEKNYFRSWQESLFCYNAKQQAAVKNTPMAEDAAEMGRT